MLISGMSTPKMYICPSSGDVEDLLRNTVGGISAACQPAVNRFDFSGYNTLSYGYQLPYGEKGKPREGMDPRVVITADKGPYYADGGEGLPGSNTRHDKRSAVEPPSDWLSSGAASILERPMTDWRRYNSRNHAGDGQNVTFVDGHVSFEKRPIVGVNFDNIYTLQSDFDKPATYIGMVPNADQPLGPLTQTDSFIVP
jgi:prepilin-type processing-associated H-X9-DG protein